MTLTGFELMAAGVVLYLAGSLGLGSLLGRVIYANR